MPMPTMGGSIGFAVTDTWKPDDFDMLSSASPSRYIQKVKFNVNVVSCWQNFDDNF